MKQSFSFIAVAGVMALGAGTAALAGQINTGGEQGAYHSKFCPLVSETLKKAQFDFECTTSKGSAENIQRVSGDPKQLGFSQLDVYSLETSLLGGEANFTTIRSDIARECLFLVTKNEALTNYGQVAAVANQLHFILPPEGSGNAGTFSFLQQIDPDGLGLANNVTRADSTDTALDAVLSSQDETAITLFVQFADPDNTRFKRIAERGGRFIPVIDRNILRQEVGGEKIYYPEETEVENANWVKQGEKVVTACTPMVLFTGHPDLLKDDKARADQKDLIKTLKDADISDFRPEEGYFSRLFKQTKEFSAKGVESMIELSEDARKAAKPVMEKAKEKAKEMGEKAKELGDKASEMGKKAMDEAEPMLDKATEASKKALEKAKELGGKAMEKAGEMADEAKKGAEELMKDKE